MATPDPAKPTIMDLTVVSTNFPSRPVPELLRENVVNRLKSILSGDNQIVAIEGEEGLGKTTTLAQFARTFPNNTFSIFMTAGSRLSQDPDLIKLDLASQLFWTLTSQARGQESVDDSVIKVLVYQIQRLARRNQQTYYLLIDGLEMLPESIRIALLHTLTGLLPLGSASFRFLITGDVSLYRPHIHHSVSIKSYPLTELTLDETKKLLPEPEWDDNTLHEIHQLCRGVPGRICTVRRALQGGIKLSEFVKESLAEDRDFFTLDWRQVDQSDELLLLILAVVAHDNGAHTPQLLADLLHVPANEILRRVSTISFLSLDEQTHVISFSSDALRRFAAQKLFRLKQRVHTMFIEHLMTSENSDAAVLTLPVHLNEAGKLQELLNYLSADHIVQLLVKARSLSKVQEAVSLGMSTARRLERDAELVRFGIQNAVVAQLSRSGVWVSEIEALASLREYQTALAVANNAVLKEDRLHLLAALAHGKQLNSDPVEPELKDAITLLCQQVDVRGLGPRATEIAKQLVSVCPETSIELTDRSSAGDFGEHDDGDRYVELSMFALNAHRNDPRGHEVLEMLRRRHKDRRLELLGSAHRILFGDLKLKKVIAQVERLERPAERLLLLRAWLKMHADHQDAGRISEYAIDLAVRTTELTVDAALLSDLAVSLGYVVDARKRRELFDVIQGLKGNAERLGPTVAYVNLQLLLAKAEGSWNARSSLDRLTEIRRYVESVGDITTRAECLASMLARSSSIRTPYADNFARECSERLDETVLALLDGTADHYLSMRRIIMALADNWPSKAIEYVQMVNTQSRREACLKDIVDVLTSGPIRDIDVKGLENVLNQMVETATKDDAVRTIIERLSLETRCDEATLERFTPFIGRAADVSNAVQRCRLCATALDIMLGSVPIDHALVNHLQQVLRRTWEGIDTKWSRIDVGFRITQALAARSPGQARFFLAETEKLKEETRITAFEPANAYLMCIRLAIRAFVGLLLRNADFREDVDVIASLINVLPSYGARATLWSDLCLRAYRCDRKDLSLQIGQERLKPTLEMLPKEDLDYRSSVLVTVAPALYVTHSTTCVETLKQLPIEHRDGALANVISFLLTGSLPGEPEDSSEIPDLRVSYEAAVDACALMEMLESDSLIYASARQLCDLLRNKENLQRINSAQREDIARRLEKVALTKLPIPREIKHAGFQVIALAKAYRLRRASDSEWRELVSRAKKIPNTADRAIVCVIVGVSLPQQLSREREELIQTATEDLANIHSIHDRVGRAVWFAEELIELEPMKAREFLRVAGQQLRGVKDNDDALTYQRRLVDLANRIDTDLAQELVDLFDDDVVKKRAQAELKVLRLKQEVVDNKASTEDLATAKCRDLRRIGQMLVRGLASGRISHQHLSRMRPYIEAAGKHSLEDSYWLVVWVIENAIARFGARDQAALYLRPLFDATVIGAQLAGQIAGKELLELKQIRHRASAAPDLNARLIRPGSREEAFEILRKWFESEAREMVTIVDQYFSPSDLSIIMLLQGVNPACSVQVLTSRKHQPKPAATETLEDLYINYWYQHTSDQQPPRTEIAVIGTSAGDSPIHDRWILSNAAGLVLGTSLNSLGTSKVSEIRWMTAHEAEERALEVEQYVRGEKMEHRGERLRVTKFFL